MFSSSIQPSIISLFSSTGTEPLQLFVARTDSTLPSDSVIHLLHDKLSWPLPPSPVILISPAPVNEDADGSPIMGHSLDQTVLHMQSPTLRKTYIQCPSNFTSPRDRSTDLGIKLPWLHLQVRSLGREWSFETGLVDQSGRIGVLRISTFQKEPCLKLNYENVHSPPLLHLPLSFPSRSSRPLTAWSTLALHLPSLLSHFSSPNLIRDSSEVGQWRDGNGVHYSSKSASIIPSGTYSHVSYVRVYATCRLRRIWFAESGPSQKVPWEFELFGDE